MFLGHFAMGFAAKALSPRVSLGTLLLAALFLDILWSALLLMGIEQVVITPGITNVTTLDFTYYPFSHSFIAVIGWGLLFAVGYWLVRRSLWGASVLGGLVVSHWILDLVVHRADLPLYPGSMAHVGLGLGHSMLAALLVEGLLFAGGLFLYARATGATGRGGRYGLWGLAAVLAGSSAVVLAVTPSSIAVVAWAGQLPWLLVGWAYWLDGRRAVRRVPAHDGLRRRGAALARRFRTDESISLPGEAEERPVIERDGAG